MHDDASLMRVKLAHADIAIIGPRMAGHSVAAESPSNHA
jgi:hypothetical protein